eukprot:scaffold86399_cov74-Phaeocystis_antarctica.AAC.5
MPPLLDAKRCRFGGGLAEGLVCASSSVCRRPSKRPLSFLRSSLCLSPSSYSIVRPLDRDAGADLERARCCAHSPAVDRTKDSDMAGRHWRWRRISEALLPLSEALFLLALLLLALFALVLLTLLLLLLALLLLSIAARTLHREPAPLLQQVPRVAFRRIKRAIKRPEQSHRQCCRGAAIRQLPQHRCPHPPPRTSSASAVVSRSSGPTPDLWRWICVPANGIDEPRHRRLEPPARHAPPPACVVVRRHSPTRLDRPLLQHRIARKGAPDTGYRQRIKSPGRRWRPHLEALARADALRDRHGEGRPASTARNSHAVRRLHLDFLPGEAALRHDDFERERPHANRAALLLLRRSRWQLCRLLLCAAPLREQLLTRVELTALGP